MMDPENPIVKLCAEGMQAEAKRDFVQAKGLFETAWQTAQDDYEAAIAAHYLARQQSSNEETLSWNLIALERAQKVDLEKVRGFYPSLYLNVGHSYELMEDFEKAKANYEKAVSGFEELTDDAYGSMVKDAVQRALARIASAKRW